MGAAVEVSGGNSEEEEEEQEEDDVQEEEEEEEETSEVSGAHKNGASSEDEEEHSIGTITCKKTSGKRVRVVCSDDEESEDEGTLSWIPDALTSIKAVDSHMIRCRAWSSHTSLKSCLPDLKRVREATTCLVRNMDAAISFVTAQQSRLDKKDLEAQISALRQELAHKVKQSQEESRNQALLLQEAKAVQLKQSLENQSLRYAYRMEKEALMAKHIKEQSVLNRQLEEEKDKSICCVCREKPRDTIILPCLHFQYCFSCLLRHRDVHSNTCPTCRGPIQGLNMSSYLAA